MFFDVNQQTTDTNSISTSGIVYTGNSGTVAVDEGDCVEFGERIVFEKSGNVMVCILLQSLTLLLLTDCSRKSNWLSNGTWIANGGLVL